MSEAPPATAAPSWIRSPWVKWSWLIVLGVIIALNLDFHFRWLPTNASGYAARGRADYNDAEYESAIKNFTKSIAREPDNIEAYIWRGESYAKLRDIVNATTDLEKALRMQPEYNKAIAAFADGRAAAWDTAGAIDWYTKALARDPEYVRLYLERAMCYYDTARWSEATADLDKSVSLGLDETRITSILLGWAAKAHNGNAYGASVELADLMKAGQIRGDRFWLSAQFLSGQIPETTYLAEMQKAKAGDLNALAVEAYYLAGVKRLVFGDSVGAESLLRKALETNADYVYAYDRARVELENLLLGFHPIAATIADAGLTVGSVTPGGPAEAAGMASGTIVETVAGKKATQERILELLSQNGLDSTVELTIADKAGATSRPVSLRLGASSPTK